ncbi:MAG: LysR family transcriptional regulator [Lachnospiraceae bacterium]|nr:LysR family transcriptional regulator [Lachnospiraceae bacterium]
MNQLDIYCFTSIARTKSFSITARELMISQQAVSNHIKTLEEEIGYTLFFRYGPSAALTKAGEIFLDYLIKRDQLISDFFKENNEKKETDPFFIAWTQWAGCPSIAEKLLKEFRQEYPDDLFLIGDMPAEKVKEAIREKKIDILFTSQYSVDYMSMSWEHTFICSQEVYLVHSKRIEYDMDDLGKYPFFAIPAGETNEHMIVENAKNTCARMGFVPKNVIICNDIGSAYLNVLTMDGLSFGAENTTKLPMENFKLTPTGIYSDYMMCSPFYPQDPSVARFISFIKEKIKTIPHRSIKEAGQ